MLGCRVMPSPPRPSRPCTMLQWVEDEADLPADAVGAPRSRSRKSGKKKGKGSKGSAGSEQPAEEEPSGAELDRREIASMEQILGNDPGWLAFSISTAKWVPFSVDPEMQRAFADTSYVGSNDETVARWMHRAETSVIHHIIHRIIEREKRADLFRALGRGWVCLCPSKPDRFAHRAAAQPSRSCQPRA